MTPFEFFFEHAGYSYDPKIETREAGRARCAVALAEAERIAREADCSFHWQIDPHINSSDFSDDPDPWALWVCLAYNAKGEVFASLGGVDFGRDGEPWGDPCRRVVEAELALEFEPEEVV